MTNTTKYDDFDLEIQIDELPEPFVPTAEDYIGYEGDDLGHAEGAD